MATFNGSEGGVIPLAEARKWTANYRATIKPGETEAHYFGADTFHKLLNEDKSVGIRIYYAIDDTGKKQLLMVGVDEDGNNLLPSESSAKSSDAAEGNAVYNHSYPCPPFCGTKPI